MTRLALAAALLLAATPAFAQNCSSNQIGQFGYTNCTDSSGGSWSGTSNQIGQFNYQNWTGPNGQSRNCTSNTIGQFTYTNCN